MEVYAVYKNGALKPIRNLDLPEGTVVKIKISLVRPIALYSLVKKYSQLFENVKEDPLEALLKMRER